MAGAVHREDSHARGPLLSPVSLQWSLGASGLYLTNLAGRGLGVETLFQPAQWDVNKLGAPTGRCSRPMREGEGREGGWRPDRGEGGKGRTGRVAPEGAVLAL